MGRQIGRWVAAWLTRDSGPNLFYPAQIHRRAQREETDSIKYEQDNAAEWLTFRHDNNCDLGHPPGCDCRWCS